MRQLLLLPSIGVMHLQGEPLCATGSTGVLMGSCFLCLVSWVCSPCSLSFTQAAYVKRRHLRCFTALKVIFRIGSPPSKTLRTTERINRCRSHDFNIRLVYLNKDGPNNQLSNFVITNLWLFCARNQSLDKAAYVWDRLLSPYIINRFEQINTYKGHQFP